MVMRRRAMGKKALYVVRPLERRPGASATSITDRVQPHFGRPPVLGTRLQPNPGFDSFQLGCRAPFGMPFTGAGAPMHTHFFLPEIRDMPGVCEFVAPAIEAGGMSTLKS